MNVFEELIVELKEQNLLESTVIEQDQEADSEWEGQLEPVHPSFTAENEAERDEFETMIDEQPAESPDPQAVADVLDEPTVPEVPAAATAASVLIPAKPSNGREFYKKRAINEISNLQMVEHIMTGVEREYLKVVPKAFDDYEAKKRLNAFLQISGGENSSEHAETEFALMQETEAWCTALEGRDKHMPVSALRQYCENSRPALSSQALVALARFYRNLPYSETSRAKFDFVATRLFSRATPDHKRVCLFTREEMANHIELLYREWSSISLYSAEEDDSKLLLTALSFEELAVEAENVTKFDVLITSDFFGRLRIFKESVSELFYAPPVTAAAIECNVRIGNAYVSLIDRERNNFDAGSLYSKFDTVNSRFVSDTLARTLEIVDIMKVQKEREVLTSKLKTTAEADLADNPEAAHSEVKADQDANETPAIKWEGSETLLRRLKEKALAVNKWFLMICLLIVAASVGVYIWANVFVEESTPSATVQSADIDNTILKLHIKTAKISGHNFYGLMQPSWDGLTDEKKEEFLQATLDHARSLGCTQVNLINGKGQSVGFASAGKIEVLSP